MEQPQSSSAQQITPTNELVPLANHVSIGRCNNKTTLLNIPCLKECRIARQILTDHALSYVFTAITDKKDTIYTLDMCRAALKLPTSTAEQPFIRPADFDYIKAFLKILGYQGPLKRVSALFVKNLAQPWQKMFKANADYASLIWSDILYYVMQSNKTSIQYPCFTKLIIADLMEKYESISKSLDKEYHTIKDDTPLITEESSTPKTSLKIRIIQKKSTPTAPLPPSDDRERDGITEATQLSLAKDKTVKDESSGSEFVDTILLSDEDFSDRIENESHKENPTKIDDDDEKKDDKHDDAKDNKDKNDDDHHNDQSLILWRMGSLEIRTEKMQIHIPSPPGSIKTDLSSDKEIGIMKEVNEALREIVPKLTTSTTNDRMKDNLPKMVNDNVKKEREYDAFRKRYHDDHPGDDAPQEVEKSAKRQKTSRSSKSTRGSSSKQPAKESNTSASKQP
ncbi:hypothetical protein Tco_1092627 [Tanacetum coccineum]|uniref:Uncharacterized protein n=1 Tax=Tanacetum coccineum TaxID=301880 RepID=A0ABQ5IBP4_9ASTR